MHGYCVYLGKYTYPGYFWTLVTWVTNILSRLLKSCKCKPAVTLPEPPPRRYVHGNSPLSSPALFALLILSMSVHTRIHTIPLFHTHGASACWSKPPYAFSALPRLPEKRLFGFAVCVEPCRDRVWKRLKELRRGDEGKRCGQNERFPLSLFGKLYRAITAVPAAL